MRSPKNLKISRTALLLIILTSVVSISAIGFSNSILQPFGIVTEGSFFAGLLGSPEIPGTVSETDPRIATDKSDYRPGETAQIFGSGFWPNELVTLQVVHVGPTGNRLEITTPHQGHDPWVVMVDESGNFSSQWVVDEDSTDQVLLLTADQPQTNDHEAIHEERTFTDGGTMGADKAMYRLATNVWTTGNAGSTVEGKWISYMYVLEGVDPNEPLPSFSITYPIFIDGSDGMYFDGASNFRLCIDTPTNECASQGGSTPGTLPDGIPRPIAPNNDTGWTTYTPRDSIGNLAVNLPYGNCSDPLDPIASGTQGNPGTAPCELRYFRVTPGQGSVPSNIGTSSRISFFFEFHLSQTPLWVNSLEKNFEPFEANAIPTHPNALPLNQTYGYNIYNTWNNPFPGSGQVSIGSSQHVNITDFVKGPGGTQNTPSGALTLPIPTVQPTLAHVISGQKFEDLDGDGVKDAGEPGLAGWAITLTGTLEDGTTNISFPTFTDANGNYSFTNIYPGTYTINETPQAGYVQTAPNNTGAGVLPNGTANPIGVAHTGGTYSLCIESDPTSSICPSTQASPINVAGIDFGNNQPRGSIKIVKNTVGGIPLKTYNWAFTPVGFNGGSVINLSTTGVNDSDESSVFGNLLVSGTYSVSETSLPAGWDLTGSSCTNGTPASITVVANTTTVCTFTNTEDVNETRGRIVVDKVTFPAGDGQLFTFNPTGFNSDASFQLADATTPFDSGLLIPTADGGSYSVNESAQTGWDLTSFTCDNGTIGSITVVAGQTTTCTATNTKRGHIIVDKVTLPSGDPQSFSFDATGGTSPTYNDFSLTDAAAPNDQTLKPGAYSVSETVPSSWDLTSSPCVSSIGDTETAGALELDPGETITCTFTNTKRGHIIVVKDAVPNDAQDFSFTNNFGNGNPSPFSLDDDSEPTLQNSRDSEITPGTYSVSEGAVSNWTLTSATCSDGSPVSAIVVSPGETVTCTFVNTKQASVRVVKNTFGGDDTFTFDTSGTLNGGGSPTVPDPLSVTTSGGTGTSATFVFSNLPAAGSSLGFTENALAGWSPVGTPSCTGGDGDNTNPVNMNVEPGETIVCTFTNTKPDAQIDLDPLTATNEVNDAHTITATVQQDDMLPAGAPGDGATGFGPAPDGTLVSFSLSNNSAGATFVGGVSTCTISNGLGTCSVSINTSTAGGVDIHATTTFSVAGVSLTRSTGSGGLNSADAHKTYVDAQIDVTPLDDTNPVNQPHTITATVQQDDGIAAPAGDNVDGFGPAPDGTTVTFSFITNTAGATFVGDDSDCITSGGSCSIQINAPNAGVVVVQATTTFTIGGVSVTRTTGSGGLNSGNARKVYVDAQIDVTPLEDTNPVGQAHTITATVLQNDGLPAGAPGDSVTGFGAAPDGTTVNFSFVINTAGATFVSGVNSCTTTAGSCSIQINSTSAGLVIVNATTTFSVGGQNLTRTTGTGGLNSPDAQKVYVDARISISPLEDTNPINEAHTFTATVEQNDGLDAPAGDNVTGWAPAPNGTLVTFSFVTNTIGATFVSDVNTCNTTAGSCTVQINSSSPGTVEVQATTSFSVGGQSLTRTTGTGGGNSGNAVKHYVAGRIIVDKVTVPAADTQLFGFNASWLAGGPPDFQLADATTPFNSGYLAPGSYSVAEIAQSGWDLTSATCSGDDDGTNPASIQLDAGETVTCTFTNKLRPKLTLIKTVTNNNGGTLGVGDFPLFISGTSATSGTTYTLDPGDYTASETNQPGYAASDWGTDCAPNGAVTLAYGDNKTCRITNNDVPPKLHLRKVVINDNGGTATTASFTLTANGTGSNDLSGVDPVDSGTGLQADTWALSETNVYGYTASNWVCVGGSQNGSNITVGIGGEATCTITNNDQPGTIIIKKITKPAGATTSFPFDAVGTGYNDFSLTDGTQNSQTLNAGSYSAQELVPLGWVLTGIGGSTNLNTPYACTVTGSGGSSGNGSLITQTVDIDLRNGDTVTCVFENTGQGVTRTQGFWATHPQLAEIAWNGGTAFGHTFPGVPDKDLCGRTLTIDAGVASGGSPKPLEGNSELMGGFWSSISRGTTGAKRDKLDQARMQLLQQLLAAELNASAFGSVPAQGSITAWESAYCGTKLNDINRAQQQAASFNTAGDSGTFTPGTSADSKLARFIAKYSFWDVLP